MNKPIYKAKTLFMGHRVGLEVGKLYVGVPDKKFEKAGSFIVEFDGEKREFNWKDAETYRVFEDKFGRGFNYTLAYYRWDKNKQEKPIEKTKEDQKPIEPPQIEIDFGTKQKLADEFFRKFPEMRKR